MALSVYSPIRAPNRAERAARPLPTAKKSLCHHLVTIFR